MKKELRFTFCGDEYRVNEQGHINANGIGRFSADWVFLGGCKHHWCNHPTVSLQDAFQSPDRLNGCLGWDIDHGTTREWAGQWNGKLPRITGAHVANA